MVELETAAERSPGALAGLRVLELGSLEAADYCGKLFADFGAEVVKAEPEGGDPRRRLSPQVEIGGGRSESAQFAWLNTNKRSVLDDPELVDRLARASDVLIDARPGPQAAAWRRDLRTRSAGLTIVSLSWFGENGPYAGFQGADSVVRALAGSTWPLGAPGAPPEPLNDHQAGVVGGLSAFTAALAARLSSAPGRAFEVGLLEACAVLSEYYVAIAASPGFVERRYGRNRFPPTFPMGVYPCREGWLGVTVVTVDQWRNFCELLDMADAGADPGLRAPINRFHRADELEAVFAPRLRAKTAAQWFALARERKLPWVIAPDMADLGAQAVHRARGAFARVEIGEAAFEAPALPQRMAQPRAPGGGRAPLAGEDTQAYRGADLEARSTQPPRPTERPLHGVRIVDLTMGWAGTLATRQLADLGADVVKVESCGYADWWRGGDSRAEAVTARLYEKSAPYNAMNRNKKGVTLDLARPQGAELLKRLVAGADAVIENYSQEVLPKFALDYPHLCAVRPDLVMVSMPAFAGDGEWRDVRAYGSTLEHASGLPHVTGRADDPPTMNHLAYGDPVGGLNAAAALLVALFHQRRTGEGQHVDFSQVQGLLPLVARWFIERSVSGGATRWGGRHPDHAPHGAFPCAGDEQWVMLAVTSDAMWARLCGWIGREDLARDPALATAAGRRAQADRIDAAVAAWTSERSAEAAMDQLQAAGVAAGAVRRPSELLSDRHLVARKSWETVDRAWIGPHPQLLAPFREEGAPYRVLRASPTLGQSNAEVLGGELGLAPEALARLAADGVIGEQLTITAHLGRGAR